MAIQQSTDSKAVIFVVRRKADLRELKRLHVQENRLMQALGSKALAAREEQMKKFEIDKQVSTSRYRLQFCGIQRHLLGPH